MADNLDDLRFDLLKLTARVENLEEEAVKLRGQNQDLLQSVTGLNTAMGKLATHVDQSANRINSKPSTKAERSANI